MPHSFLKAQSSVAEESAHSHSSIQSNASAIAQHYIPGINQLVDLTFSIEGKTLTYYRDFELKQSSQTHHEFTASFSHDCLGGRETHEMEESQKLVGKRLLVSMHYKNNTDKPKRYFVGSLRVCLLSKHTAVKDILFLKGLVQQYC
ncbi:hypothetical protein QNH98_00020 [Myroides sp. mNGS23_01]|nr:hypothetical protein [Myroides sp. mNGS23_01]WHT39156.1 hypothetical protein QNH98_00020 [Myroides sp. mNGS23_01]